MEVGVWYEKIVFWKNSQKPAVIKESVAHNGRTDVETAWPGSQSSSPFSYYMIHSFIIVIV